MAITMNTAILRTPTGLFKMLELVLVFICLLIARLGLESGTTYVWQNHDLLFFVIGTLVGFVIIMPAILFAYMLGAAMPILVRENCKRGHTCIYAESIETVAEHFTLFIFCCAVIKYRLNRCKLHNCRRLCLT